MLHNRGHLKRCGKCGLHKPLAQFHKDKSRRDGRHPYCAECQTKKASQWCRDNRGRARINEKKYKRAHKIEIALRNRDYDVLNREKRNAHSKANQALKKGLIVKPLACACGRAGRLHMHHEDYAKPLDVRWLCAFCHARHHAEEKRDAKACSQVKG